MKLASLNDRAPDGRLVVVSRDLQQCADAGGMAPTLLHALQRWNEVEAPLRQLYEDQPVNQQD